MTTNFMPETTQQEHPWRATLRTVFAVVVSLAAAWGVVVAAAGVDPEAPFIATSLAVAAAVTRILALPDVDTFLGRFLPWLASAPTEAEPEYYVPGFDEASIDEAEYFEPEPEEPTDAGASDH